MQEPITNTTNDDEKDVLDQQGSNTGHICACGEQYRHRPGAPSPRETCKSPMQFGDSCCCRSDNESKGDHHCGHGSRCH